ncbi:bactericidal permeability-increasing protein-like [Xenia sp. Carnegie-2017]|uniref:bactericidal permeability-increasing protein-like n=1 Tax=Xenia sp. Carnegie-2017 TaxID=2897299 RepID=UPI001F03FC56|nr:bactericidal permeability-increasing protein-like [Xenia sp. Carnegie-2017]
MFHSRSFCVLFIVKCFVFLTETTSTLNDRPGVRTLLTTRGLDFVRKIAVPVILKRLENLSLPEISGEANLILGDLSYNLKNITLSEVKIPKSRVLVYKDRGVFLEGKEIQLKVLLLWSYKVIEWPFVNDHGSATVLTKDLSINVVIGSNSRSELESSLSAKDCHVNIGNLDIVFHGGASVLYNFFFSFIKYSLKEHISKMICPNVVRTINEQINNRLRTIPDETNIGNITLKINYNLTRPLRFLSNAVEFQFKGEFINKNYPKRSPYEPTDLPDIKNKVSKMLYTWITAYTINTLFFALHQTPSKRLMFYNHDIPEGIPVRLNTNNFMLTVPQLFIRYRNKEMAVSYLTSSPRKISLNVGNGNVKVFGKMTFYVIDNNRLINCFTLGLVDIAKIDDVLIYYDEKDKHSYVGLKVSRAGTNVVLDESNIGSFNVLPLKVTINILSEVLYYAYISRKMEKGFRLPIPKNIMVKNGYSAIGKDHIQVESDFDIICHRKPCSVTNIRNETM